MNAAYFHLTLNHLPVIGLLFSLAVAAVAWIKHNRTALRTGLWALFVSGLLAIPAYLTGEPAEEIVEGLPGTADALVERHEEAAVYGLTGSLVVGLLAAVVLFLSRKNRPVPVWGGPLVLLLSLLSVGAMAWTAKLGGEIRHPEIRSGETTRAVL